jgi:hypothetical protein
MQIWFSLTMNTRKCTINVKINWKESALSENLLNNTINLFLQIEIPKNSTPKIICLLFIEGTQL